MQGIHIPLAHSDDTCYTDWHEKQDLILLFGLAITKMTSLPLGQGSNRCKALSSRLSLIFAIVT